MSSAIHPMRQRLQSSAQIIAVVLVACMATTPFAAQAGCNDQEVGYIASFDVKPGSEAEFEAAISKLAQTVQRVESGAVLYAPYKGAGGKYYMMERYENEAARKAHGSDPEVQALFPTLGDHLAGAPDIQPVSAVCD